MFTGAESKATVELKTSMEPPPAEREGGGGGENRKRIVCSVHRNTKLHRTRR